MALIFKNILFVSWCGLELLRPRTVQVGRVAKGIRRLGWRPKLICATFQNDTEMFDQDLKELYRQSISSTVELPDLEKYDEKLVAQIQAASSKIRPWVEAARDEVIDWARSKRRPIVVSFAQPWESHRAVLAAKMANPDIKWVAHFSDPWVDSPYAERGAEATAAAKVHEKAVIEMADAIVFVTQQTADLVMGKYPSELQSKVRVIPHMLDLDVLNRLKPAIPGPPLCRLVHAGSLYEGRRAPLGLFQAIAELRDEGKLDPKFRLHFVGDMPVPVRQIIEQRGLTDHVSWTTQLFYLPSLREMNAADAFIVIDADFETSPFLPSKVFDYLLFDKPIMALTPSVSATAQFLEGVGYPTIRPSNVAKIKESIQQLLADWRAGALGPSVAHAANKAHYDIPNVAPEYSAIFRSLQN